MTSPAPIAFAYPLALGNRWDYEFRVAADLDAANILDAIGKFFGYQISDVISDEEMRQEFNIVRRVDEVVAVREFHGIPVFLIHSDSFNDRNEKKLGYAMAVWQDESGWKQMNLLLHKNDGHLAFPVPGAQWGRTVAEYHDGSLAAHFQEAQLIVKRPLRVGEAWDVDTVIGEEEIWAPAGSFTCFVVRRAIHLFGKQHDVDYFYADGVGLVQILTPLYTIQLSAMTIQ